MSFSHAGGGLGVHDGEEPCVRVLALRRRASRCGSSARPHARLDADDLGAAAPGHLAHALAEHAVHADDRGVARLEQVDEAGFHARRARPADRQRERVRRAEHGAQALHRLVERARGTRDRVPEHGSASARQRPRGTGSTARVPAAGGRCAARVHASPAGFRNAASELTPRVRTTSGDQSTRSVPTSARTSSPATRPRATSAAARATCVTSSSGRRMPWAAAIWRTVCVMDERGARRESGAVRAPEDAVDRQRDAPCLDLVGGATPSGCWSTSPRCDARPRR